MKRFSEQFKKQSDRISMRASERAELRARVVSYMEYHPLPKEIVAKTSVPSKVNLAHAIPTEPFFTISFSRFPIRSFAGAFVLLVIVGIPVIAEKALPGDVLYPVKVQFTEEIRSSLSLSPYAKVEWETQRLERRISEARLLASEGRLTEEAQADFAEAVKTHTDAAQHEIAILKESDKDSAAIAEIAFASALEVQSQVLEGHIEHSQGTATSDDGHSVLALAEVVQQARTTAEAAQVDAKPSYEKLVAAVEESSTQAYELFESVKKNASPDEIADIDRRLADINRKMKVAVAYKEGTVNADETIAGVHALALSTQQPQAKVAPEETPEAAMMLATMAPEEASGTALSASKMMATDTAPSDVVVVPETPEATDSENISTDSQTPEEDTPTVASEEDANEVLRATLKDIQKLLNYLTNIDVRENVSIDELVPVTPTSEEKATETMRLYDEARIWEQEVLAKELSSKVRVKVNKSIKDLDAQFEAITKAMQSGSLDDAFALATQAHLAASDLRTLTAAETDTIKEEIPVTQVATTTETILQ